MWRSFLPILCYIFTKNLNSTETYALVSKMVRFLQKQRRVSQYFLVSLFYTHIQLIARCTFLLAFAFSFNVVISRYKG